MGAVWLLVGYLEKNGKSVTVGLAVEGHLIGEMASAAFTFLARFLVPPQRKETNETRWEKERERGKKKSGPNLVKLWLFLCWASSGVKSSWKCKQS